MGERRWRETAEAHAGIANELKEEVSRLDARCSELEAALDGQRNMNGCWCYVVEDRKKQQSKRYVHDVQCDKARAVLDQQTDNLQGETKDVE